MTIKEKMPPGIPEKNLLGKLSFIIKLFMFSCFFTIRSQQRDLFNSWPRKTPRFFEKITLGAVGRKIEQWRVRSHEGFIFVRDPSTS